jgi:hypothetical protein
MCNRLGGTRQRKQKKNEMSFNNINFKKQSKQNLLGI